MASKKEEAEEARLNELIRSRSDSAPLLMEHALFVGKTGTGKSYLICSLLSEVYRKVFSRIYFVHGTWLRDMYCKRFDVPDEQVFTEWDDSIIDTIESDTERTREKKGYCFPLVIIDDQLEAWSGSEKLRTWMTKVRHQGITVWATLQACKGFIYPRARIQFRDIYLAASSATHADREIMGREFAPDLHEFSAAMDLARRLSRERNTRFIWLHIRPLDPAHTYWLQEGEQESSVDVSAD